MFTLTTVDIVDLDFNSSKPFEKVPLIDPNQYKIRIDQQKIKGNWVTSNMDQKNIIEGEIVRIRKDGKTI